MSRTQRDSQDARDSRAAQAVLDTALTTPQHWTKTNLGAQCVISHEGEDFTLIVTMDGVARATIPWRSGRGGVEPFGWSAQVGTAKKLQQIASDALTR